MMHSGTPYLFTIHYYSDRRMLACTFVRIHLHDSHLFADDTNVFYSDKCLEDVYKMRNDKLRNMCKTHQSYYIMQTTLVTALLFDNYSIPRTNVHRGYLTMI